MESWSFLTNHARVLVCIAHDSGVRLRDIAERVGITERSAFAIVADLTDAGYVVKERDGRRNRYHVQVHLPLPDTVAPERTVGEAPAARRADDVDRLAGGNLVGSIGQLVQRDEPGPGDALLRVLVGPVGVAAMPEIGSFSSRLPVLPRNGASPKAKMPPSLATSQ